MKSVSRDNTQLLFNRIFSLPTERGKEGVFATLPDTITRIPREKPVCIDEIITFFFFFKDLGI